jgi:hypothetical protein
MISPLPWWIYPVMLLVFGVLSCAHIQTNDDNPGGTVGVPSDAWLDADDGVQASVAPADIPSIPYTPLSHNADPAPAPPQAVGRGPVWLWLCIGAVALVLVIGLVIWVMGFKITPSTVPMLALVAMLALPGCMGGGILGPRSPPGVGPPASGGSNGAATLLRFSSGAMILVGLAIIGSRFAGLQLAPIMTGILLVASGIATWWLADMLAAHWWLKPLALLGVLGFGVAEWLNERKLLFRWPPNEETLMTP